MLCFCLWFLGGSIKYFHQVIVDFDNEGYSCGETLLINLESIVNVDWLKDYFNPMVLVSNPNPLRK
jgi:hypothetical protein